VRTVFIGAGSLAVMTARLLLRRRHEVVMVEREKGRIDALSEELDCGFVHGDGSKPAILRETDPEQSDVLFCLTGSDQANIIASLVGRSLGFPRVITKVEDPEFEHICVELGLEETIIPSRTIGRYLVDTVGGMDLLELSGLLKDEARLFSFVARVEDAVPLDELNLPSESRVVWLYRDGRFLLPERSDRLRVGDEVVVITHSRYLATLRERWEVQHEREHGH